MQLYFLRIIQPISAGNVNINNNAILYEYIQQNHVSECHFGKQKLVWFQNHWLAFALHMLVYGIGERELNDFKTKSNSISFVKSVRSCMDIITTKQ